jgi:uncharacterized protein YbaR (Trm112 family)/SAM-dependent methyltransferase
MVTMSLIRTIDTRLTSAYTQLKNWNEFAFGWRRLGIRAGDLVLEVGSGQKPMPRSDVLCDKFLFDGTERGGNRIIADRPLVVGDAERLPFKDKAFDFVYTSHLIEHVDRPERFCAELMRVARRGYITCPSEFAEKFIGWGVHRWLVSVDRGKLVLAQKDRPIYDMTLSSFCHNPQRMNDGAPLNRFISAYPEIFWIQFPWNGTFEYEVHRVTQRAESGWTVANAEIESLNPSDVATQMSLKRRLGSLWSRGVRAVCSNRAAVVLTDILACPACSGALSIPDEKTIVCSACGHSYRMIDGVPFLLEPPTSPVCAESAAS